MKEQFKRTAMVLTEEGVEALSAASVAVFGIGGVGGYVVEALARAGIGRLILVDNDKISESNINRQILALHSTVGMYKTEAAKKRILEINPGCTVETVNIFYLPENAEAVEFKGLSYVVDAVDTVTAKLEIISKAEKAKVPVISVMGTGNKLDPSAFTAADIYDTSVCPLCRVMRRECRKRGIKSLKCVYSKEEPFGTTTGEDERRAVPGSVSFVPGAAGLIAAGEVIKDIVKKSSACAF